MPTSLEKLQTLLRGLFQFELSDLDFGIYRLFRLKKNELEKFLGQQIPQAVEQAFADLAEGDTGKLKAEVADLAQKISEELELDAILDDGSLNPRYDKAAIGRTTRLMVNDYEEKSKRLRGLLATENQKDDVFNHLHAFFSRYYDRGDFIARRFFGASALRHAIQRRGNSFPLGEQGSALYQIRRSVPRLLFHRGRHLGWTGPRPLRAHKGQPAAR